MVFTIGDYKKFVGLAILLSTMWFGVMAMAYSFGVRWVMMFAFYDSPDFPVQINAVHEKGELRLFLNYMNVPC